jgi:hypothetical protein
MKKLTEAERMKAQKEEDELDKALWKAWDEYDPEGCFNYETGEQEVHTVGKEALFNYDDVEEAFINGFHMGAEYARGIK